jgi:hypothetical protein
MTVRAVYSKDGLGESLKQYSGFFPCFTHLGPHVPWAAKDDAVMDISARKHGKKPSGFEKKGKWNVKRK